MFDPCHRIGYARSHFMLSEMFFCSLGSSLHVDRVVTYIEQGIGQHVVTDGGLVSTGWWLFGFSEKEKACCYRPRCCG